ncbi:MAG: Na+/H+ antiporter subunit D [Leadbetterella sp.]|nr:Na+/H+ antiporter subunit D [Leadbetterella sp.]
MTDNSIIATLIIHLLAALLQLAFWRKTVTQRYISVTAASLSLISAATLFYKVYSGGILIMNAANWRAPFGIVFVADLFSSSLVLITAIASLAVAVFSAAGINRARMLYGYFPIFHFLVMGLNGAFLTGDIFNLYVWFEVIIIASFVLMTLGGRKAQLEGAVKYMALNILASMFFLTGIGVLYGITGSLNMADLALRIPKVENQSLINLTSMFFLLGFGIKSAVFPLYFWLPSSYHTPPSAVAATFGGLLTKVGIYALFRVFTLLFTPDDTLKNLLVVIAVFTIVTGMSGALIKDNIRRLFSSLIVCHIGFMVGGLGLYSKVAMMGAVFYLFHDILVKTNMFLIAGLIRQLRGSMNMKLLGGDLRTIPHHIPGDRPGAVFPGGIPPLSGFWPKLYLIEAGFDAKKFLLVGAIIAGSFVTLYVIARMWSEVFWKNPSGDERIQDTFAALPKYKKTFLVLPVVLLCFCSLVIGLDAQFIIEVVDRITDEMINTAPYIKAVLG